jgi:hypothetical protein
MVSCKTQNIAAFGVNPVAPQNLAAQNIEQLRRDAHFIAGAHENRRQNGVDAQFLSGFARVDVRALIFGDDRDSDARSTNEAARAR